MKFDAGTVRAYGLLINLRYYWYGCRPHPLGKFKIVNFIVNLSKECVGPPPPGKYKYIIRTYLPQPLKNNIVYTAKIIFKL